LLPVFHPKKKKPLHITDTKAAIVVTYWQLMKFSTSEAGGNLLLGSVGWGRRGERGLILPDAETLCV